MKNSFATIFPGVIFPPMLGMILHVGKSIASSNQKAGLSSFVLLLSQIPEGKSETVEWEITTNHKILLMYSDIFYI